PEEPDALVLAAADPAQPYGDALPWPKRAGARAARVAGAYVVLLGGEAVLFVERSGRSLVPLRDPDPGWLRPARAPARGGAPLAPGGPRPPPAPPPRPPPLGRAFGGGASRRVRDDAAAR